MAVPNQTPYIEHVANGITKSFNFDFDCNDNDHLIVLVDDHEPIVGDWQLGNGAIIFKSAPKNGAIVKVQRNTPFKRDRDYQSYDNSFRPLAVNNDFDWIWWKLQELGVADWILGNRINALKNYVDRKDDELKAYLLGEIRKQGVALDQLDDYYNYLMKRLAQIAVDKGWDASFVVDGNENQKSINSTTIRTVRSIYELLSANRQNDKTLHVLSYWKGVGKGGNTFVYDPNMPRNKHNGGTIIDPTKSWDGTREQWAYVHGYLPDVGVGVWGVDDESKLTNETKQAILAQGGNLSLGVGLNPTNFRTNQIKLGGFLGKSSSTGFGCWVAKTKEISFTMFGAVGDAQENIDGTDDSFAMLACVRALPKTGAVLNLENYYYTHGNSDIRNIVLHFMNFNDLIIKGNLASIQSHSNNLSVTSQAIMRFDYCKDVSVSCLNTDARLDTRMIIGGDPNTHNDQHNVHIGLGCKDITFFKCSANRAIMDGFYIYGWGDSGKDSTQNITFYDCKAHYCYRQGSSHIEGLNIRYIGGSYSYTGTLPNPAGGTKGAAPMSGIDIESNSSDYAARATYTVEGVSFIGNKQKGFIASLNSYGTVSNCEFTDNKYIGLQVEYNAKKIGIFNNKFLGNTNFELYIQATMPIDIAFNLFKSANTTINCVDISNLDSSRSSVDIYRNIFEAPDGVAKGGGCSFDFAKVNFHNNNQLNMDSIWVGGVEKFSYDNNTFKTNNTDTTEVLKTWSSSRFKSVTGNTSVLVDGDLIGAGYSLENVDYLARNNTNTDPNSVNFEIKNGKVIYNQGTALAPTIATEVSQLATYVNQMRQELINQGIWKQ